MSGVNWVQLQCLAITDVLNRLFLMLTWLHLCVERDAHRRLTNLSSPILTHAATFTNYSGPKRHYETTQPLLFHQKTLLRAMEIAERNGGWSHALFMMDPSLSMT